MKINKEIEKKAVYLHIPFCKKRCAYCDFLTFANMEQMMPAYVDILIEEIQEKASVFKNLLISSVFFGGGTPSLLNEQQMFRLMEAMHHYFSIDTKAEITFEANPESLSLHKLKAFRRYFNRVSIGVQSFDDFLLSKIDRLHTREDAIRSIENAKKYFENINIDLIFALPFETIKSLEASILKAISLDIPHISAYSLILEETAPMAKKILPFPDEETERAMYNLLRQHLQAAGFSHYEISNFSKPGYASIHNRSYWDLSEYLGLGLGAASYIQSMRLKNTISLKDYMTKDFAPQEEIFIDRIESQKEFMLLGLREIEGISQKRFFFRFQQRVQEVFHDEIDRLVQKGLLQIKNDFIALTEKGLHVANFVFMEFV